MSRRHSIEERSAPKVAAVIPAFNEAKRIRTVLEVVLDTKLIDEVIVVDDGSSDDTANVAGSLQDVKVIRNETNLGKGGALQAGFLATGADIVVTLDADLTGLRPAHIGMLVRPLLSDPYLFMTVGKFVGGRVSTSLAQTVAGSLSGQRAMRRELLDLLPDLTDSRFGVEMLITKTAKNHRMAMRTIKLPALAQVMKEEKLGMKEGVSSRLKMYADIAGHAVKPTRKKGAGSPPSDEDS